MNVSRETQERLDIYLSLLQKWSPKINLVSPISLKDAGRRHFRDSLQISALGPHSAEHWADMGSGGGFPGAVVAIARAGCGMRVTLVESDQRKATFLRTVSRETNVPFQVTARRIEELEPLGADVVSARALASLTQLLSYAERHLSPSGIALFQKGATWKNELDEAQKQWRFTCEVHKSETNPAAAILKIGDLSRV